MERTDSRQYELCLPRRDVDDARLSNLDRSRRVLGFYRRVNDDDKRAMKAAFSGYVSALERGDREAANAAKARFLAASEKVKGGG